MTKTYKIDLTGQKFGRLTVLEFVPSDGKSSKWKCKCECGNETVTSLAYLKSGDTKSCGCLLKDFAKKNIREVHKKIKFVKDKRYRDYDGLEKNGIKIVDFYGYNKTGDRRLYNCICTCGKIFQAVPNSILSGRLKSCGCRENYKSIVVDRVGDRVGILTCIAFKEIKNGQSHWLCRCDCGNETIVSQANLKENHIYPVSNPKVEIKEFDMNKDLEFTALVAVKPEIKIGDYKKEIDHKYTEYKERRKKENEEKLKKGEKLDDSHIHMGSNEIIEALLASSEVEVSDLLIEEETDRLISRLVNQIQAVNLSMDTYLKSQNKTSEQLRKEYEKAAENNIKAEFMLNHLVEKEKIDVEEKEVNDMISAIGDENTRKHFEDPIQRLYIKSILQKNKLISKLIEETEGEKHEH